MVTKKDVSVTREASPSVAMDKDAETAKKQKNVQTASTHNENASINDEYVKWVYAGPTLPNGILQSNAILSGRLSEILDYYNDAVVKCPQIVKLIVPLHKFSETASKAKTSGNIVNKYYNDIASAMRNEED